jgi:hypothetical protein
MWMGMASRPLGPGRLGLRAMVSAEPWTIGRSGYPLLLQTGETANGHDPLVDRQHPHDLFLELSGSYSLPIGSDGSVFVYLGLPGEPALGPPAFMHRFSAMENPEAPLTHHWLDSTHITFGVATLGWVRGPLKLEGSVFTGRAPDQDRTNIESPKMDSWSGRVSFNPSAPWAFQASYGHLHSPEQLEPEVATDRTTVSAIYDRPLKDGNWQTTFAWGRNHRSPGTTTDGYLLESAATCGRSTLFARAEKLGNDELFGHSFEETGDSRAGKVFTVGKFSLGTLYDLISTDTGKPGSSPATPMSRQRIVRGRPRRASRSSALGGRDVCEREDELPGQATEGEEAMVTVEADGLVVLGIDDEGVDPEPGTQGPRCGVPQEGAAELPPPIGLVDSEAAQPRNRN